VQFNIRRGRRQSSATAYLRPVLRRQNLTLLVNALTTKVLVDGQRATGIELLRNKRSATETVTARREVILCAGAFNTPQLLMLSGIGPAPHLHALGIKPLVDLPVGQNLQDHWAVPNFYRRKLPGYFHRRMRADRMALAMMQAYLLRSGPATKVPSCLFGFVKTLPALQVPDIEFLLMPTALSAHLWFPGIRAPYDDAFGIRPAIMHPESRGEVLLRSTDPRQPPRIRFNALQAPADIATLVRGFRMAREIASHPAMDAFRGEELLPGPGVRSPAELEMFMRRHATPVFHPVGTCAMGSTSDAVIDTALRVRGIAGLRVVDASAMPSLVTGHINACVMMMAEKAADTIRGLPALSRRGVDADLPVARSA
jgi:choline dehydrogenase-like flavoprotein